MSAPPPQLQPAGPAPGALWVEYRNPQGRPYWYHTIERRSVWERPAELKTPRERALDSTPWKEYKSGDRSYYVHSETKQSTWSLPAEVKQLLEQLGGNPASPSNNAASPTSAAPAAVQSPYGPIAAASPMAGAVPSPSHRVDVSAAGPARIPHGPITNNNTNFGPPGFLPPVPGAGRPNGPLPGFSPAGPSASLPVRPPAGSSGPHATSPAAARSASPVSNAPTPATPSATSLPQRPPPSTNVRAEPVSFRGDRDAAESAFISLLEQKKVDVDWTWEVTMRAIITEPLYKALKTIAERKNAFNKYIERLRRQRAEERSQRLELLRPIFRAMATQDKRVKSYHSFATFKKLCGDQPGFKEARDDDEAQAAYQGVVREIKEGEEAAEREIRHRNMDMLMSLLKTFEADVLTRWRDAHRTVVESDEYAQDAHLKTMEVADMLIVFDEHMNSIEKEAVEARRRDDAKRKRKERKNRDEYRKLLDELKQRGELTTRSTWSQVLNRVKDDDRFLRLVGQAGSSPLDLFYDAVDDLEMTVEKHIDAVQSHLAKGGKKVKESTPLDAFRTWIAPLSLGETEWKAVFYHLHATLLHKASEEKRRAERRRRHAIDDLRYAFKKIEPTLSLDASMDDILPRISHLSEYDDLKDDREGLEMAWSKYVKRQREKSTAAPRVNGTEKRRESITSEDAKRKRERPSVQAPPSTTGRRQRDTSEEGESRRYGHASRRDRSLRNAGGGTTTKAGLTTTMDEHRGGAAVDRRKKVKLEEQDESEEEEGQV